MVSSMVRERATSKKCGGAEATHQRADNLGVKVMNNKVRHCSCNGKQQVGESVMHELNTELSIYYASVLSC